jgi:hypothetical protein
MHTDTLKIISVIAAILLAFGYAGRGDYQDALERENASLKGAIKVCHAAVDQQGARP